MKTEPLKIALMGFARSGKDTVYGLIQKHSNEYVHKLAFGDELKFHIHRICPDLPTDPKPREAYEIFGKAMRDIDTDFWVKQLESVYLGMITDSHIKDSNVVITDLHIKDLNVVITDLRQPNEAKWCRENGFKIVYVHAHPIARHQRSVADSAWYDVNDSEKFIKDIQYDWSLTNNNSLGRLEQQVIMMLEHFRGMEND